MQGLWAENQRGVPLAASQRSHMSQASPGRWKSAPPLHRGAASSHRKRACTLEGPQMGPFLLPRSEGIGRVLRGMAVDDGGHFWKQSTTGPSNSTGLKLHLRHPPRPAFQWLPVLLSLWPRACEIWPSPHRDPGPCAPRTQVFFQLPELSILSHTVSSKKIQASPSPQTCEHDLIWRKGLHRYKEVKERKMRPS